MATEVSIENYSPTVMRLTVTNDGADDTTIDIRKGSFTVTELDADNAEIIYYDYARSNTRYRSVIDYSTVVSRALTSVEELVEYIDEIGTVYPPDNAQILKYVYMYGG